MNDSDKKILEKNYSIYLKQQQALLTNCEMILKDESLDENDQQRSKSLKFLENVFGRTTTGRKIIGTGTHHWYLYLMGETYDYFDLSTKLVQDDGYRSYCKNQITKEKYLENKKHFDTLDEKVSKILKKENSPFYIPLDEAKDMKEYLSNMIESGVL